MGKHIRAVDVVINLRSNWYIRDLTSQDFDKAISDILDMQNDNTTQPTQKKEVTQ